MEEKIVGLIPDFVEEKFFPGEIYIREGKIRSITKMEDTGSRPYILPGFIDSHVHIESSMLVPSEFARLAVVHGTVATVSDPHEIANVCGMEGVRFMLENGKRVPFKFYFGAPSCVPATTFETAGARLDVADVHDLLQNPDIKYLSEMMNFPGVLSGDPEVLQKIQIAKKLGKPVDGHAPGLRGASARQYIDAGISTDHECFTREEALDKIKSGMKIIIREGSAARNFDTLIDLLHDYPDQIMFCSDDKHPDSLVEGHINKLCSRAADKGISIFKILKAACINPVLHYNLEVGLLKTGDPADFILVKNLKDFEVIRTYINGICVAEEGKSKIERLEINPINQFNIGPKKKSDFAYPFAVEKGHIEIIQALDGQLITNKIIKPVDALINNNGHLESNPEDDLLKIGSRKPLSAGSGCKGIYLQFRFEKRSIGLECSSR